MDKHQENADTMSDAKIVETYFSINYNNRNSDPQCLILFRGMKEYLKCSMNALK